MNDHLEHDLKHEHSITEELTCHTPYAIFSVAFGLTILSFMGFFSYGAFELSTIQKGTHELFHTFHFMHIVFAATGTLITFFRFSKNLIKGLVLAVVSTSVFCSLSDIVFPYFGGLLLGLPMQFHFCWYSELHNILPFLIVGLINGIIMSSHHSSRQSLYSIFSHFIHISISSFASLFYLASQGYADWGSNIGLIFLLLIVAVVVPCTFADVIVPMAFARADKKK